MASINNAHYELISKIAEKAKTQDMSVIKNFFDQQYGVASYYSSGHPLNIGNDEKISTAGSGINKNMRIAEYRQMSNYAEVGDAIDEIADAHMTFHDDGKYARIKVSGIKLTDVVMKQVQEEAEHYFGLFSFEDNIFEYAKRLTVEGELCWENIIDKAHPEKGVVDVRFLPSETYEFAYDTKHKCKKGIAVYAASILSEPEVQSVRSTSGVGYNGSTDPTVTTTLNISAQITSGKVVFLPFEQITYINSGIYDKTGLVVYPALERARRAYNQLQLIEDAVLVYRLVRSPVRNVFTVDCGKMGTNKAKEYVRQLSKSFSSKKSYDPSTGSITGSYDPFNIMENVWIPKSAESGGVEVSSVGGEAKWGELDDLVYFLRKLYRSLKVPSSRFVSGSTHESDKTVQFGDDISYEEYRFAKYVVRSSTCFSRGLKEGFINHLKLVGLWTSAKLSTHNINVEISPPIEIEIFRKQKRQSAQIDMYKTFTGIEGISMEKAMEKYLGMSRLEVEENRKARQSELIKNALFEIKLKKLKDGEISTDDLLRSIDDIKNKNLGASGESEESDAEYDKESNDKKHGFVLPEIPSDDIKSGNDKK